MAIRRGLGALLRGLWWRHLRLNDPFWFSFMSLVATLIVLLHPRMPGVSTPSLLIVIVLFGGLFLSVQALIYLVVVVLVGLVLMTLQGGMVFGQVLGVTLSCLLVLWWVRFRSRLGLRGTSGDLMLVDLRNQLLAHARIPSLPRDWSVDAEIRPAHGSSFSGDFIVAHLNEQREVLDLIIVDVSGKGPDAAARALTLQGALGGLLGATSFGDFFPSANRFLLRQSWIDGFATAAHVRVDLRSGRFHITLAGHPPAARFFFGSGKWETTGKGGSILGITESAEFPIESGRLGVGDALILYTDGVVEVPGRDLSFGIDKLLGEAETLVAHAWRSGARSLIDSVAESPHDDRALILIRRLSDHSSLQMPDFA